MKRLLEFFSCIIFLVSCSSSPSRAPISDIYVAPPKKMDFHVVAPGETLYSIALKYDLDYKNISKINGLDSDYAIIPGQQLSLKSDVLPSRPIVKKPLKVESKNNVAEVADTFVRVAKGVVASIKSKTVSSVEKPTKSEYSAKIKWYWPTKGKVLASFKENNGLNKGIDLRGKLGESIYAAADGEVIYAGGGLRDYGKLVILKHSEDFLSAYAHSRVLNVAEGDKVKAGDKIAEIGYSGSTQVALLHFEIRVRGKPVDPMRYLPKR